MRIVKWIAVLALIAVAAGWGAGQMIAGRLAAALTEGPARAEAVTASGFPTRIGVEITGLDVPLEGGRWTAPHLRASAPLWNPLRWTITPAQPQGLILGGLPLTLSGPAEGQVTVTPGLSVAAAQARLTDPALALDGAPWIAASDLDATLTRDDGARYRLAARLAGLTLPPETRIDSLTLTGGLEFDHPLALTAPARLTGLRIDAGELFSGGRALKVAGAVTVRPDGNLDGTLTFTSRDWLDWLHLAIGGRLVDPGLEQILTTMGTLLAQQSPDGVLALPLVFRDGRMTLGPVPLGPAPRLDQRQ
ncbi:DUF2125 domain-containing protein [Paenirhodobacter sp.]|uniref:DUF2125 domain-containing protein n=1 Tax=Paenirhodobacter sp. TaxID=1965326 RepID=UPI003B415561